MKVEFLKRFSKDLDDIKTKSVKQSLIRLIELMEAVDALVRFRIQKNLKATKVHTEPGSVIIG